MSIQSALARIIMFLIVMGTVASAGLGFNALRSEIKTLQQASLEEIEWSAYQLDLELNRFNRALNEFYIGRSQMTPGLVNERFDLLWSRLSVFLQGAVGERLSAYDRESRIVADLFATMQREEARVLGLSVEQRDEARALFEIFVKFEPAIRQLTREVAQGEEALQLGVRQAIEKGTLVTALLALASLGLCVLAIVYISLENRKFRQLADANRRLADATEKANEAKSRFLTMMSHELRTPMNGVLGSLALVKQANLPGKQRRLVEQAENSGRQMIGLLTDILDFSDLSNNELAIEKAAYSPMALGEAVSAQFRSLREVRDIAFELRQSARCPRSVEGDMPRMRQALVHIANHIADTAPTRRIALGFDYEAGGLVCEFSFDYVDVPGKWQADILTQSDETSDVKFATDALGLAVARGLIDLMDGTIQLDHSGGPRIVVRVVVPSEATDEAGVRIVVLASPASLEAICVAALRGDGVEFLRRGDPSANVVLLQAGDESEADKVAEARFTYPNARLVALGAPRDPSLFAETIELPFDISTIRRAGILRIAS